MKKKLFKRIFDTMAIKGFFKYPIDLSKNNHNIVLGQCISMYIR
jgi:hypothetical protein